MAWFSDNIYLVRAMAAALCLAPLCALLGVFVTARRMSFFSDTIAHSALAGVALGFWLGFSEPTVPMVIFSLGVALAILWLKETTALLTDTIMALLLSGSVALGLLIRSQMKGFRAQFDAYLFGDIQAVSDEELIGAAILTVLIGICVFWKLNALTLLSTQEDLAHVSGVRVQALNYFFVGVLTVSVAVSIRLLGVMLVTSLIIIPAAAARNIARSLRQQILLAMAVGLASGIGGVMLTDRYDLPAGPTIVLTAIGVFVLTLILSRMRASSDRNVPGRTA